jgi:hypothetical protein
MDQDRNLITVPHGFTPWGPTDEQPALEPLDEGPPQLAAGVLGAATTLRAIVIDLLISMYITDIVLITFVVMVALVPGHSSLIGLLYAALVLSGLTAMLIATTALSGPETRRLLLLRAAELRLTVKLLGRRDADIDWLAEQATLVVRGQRRVLGGGRVLYPDAIHAVVPVASWDRSHIFERGDVQKSLSETVSTNVFHADHLPAVPHVVVSLHQHSEVRRPCVGVGDAKHAMFAPTDNRSSATTASLRSTKGQVIFVVRPTMIGRRAPVPGLVTGDPTMSQQHVIVFPGDGCVLGETMAAVTRTWLNGNLVTGKFQMNAGDVLVVGETEFHVTCGPPRNAPRRPVRPPKGPDDTAPAPANDRADEVKATADEKRLVDLWDELDLLGIGHAGLANASGLSIGELNASRQLANVRRTGHPVRQSDLARALAVAERASASQIQ